MAEKQVTNLTYDSLDELLDWWAPDCWQLDQHWYSHECCRIELLDREFRFTVWLASLSLDHRWTLSPVAGPWQSSPSELEN
jgi:hypothetical protein